MRPTNSRMIFSLLGLCVGLFNLLLLTQPVFAAAGIFESYIVLNNTFYDAGANTTNPDFHGQNLGTFVPGSIPLALSGGEVKTFKNNSTDVTGAHLYYRVYPTGSPTGSFTAVNLPFAENLSNPGDQKWATTGANIDLLNGLSNGNYTLEIYFEASTNGVDAPSTIYDSNGGNNFSATFTVASSITLSDARAMWLDTTTFAWNGTAGSSYKLLYDPDGGIVPAIAGATACGTPPLNNPCYVSLTPDSTVSGYIKNPNATGLTKLVNNSLGADLAKELVRGQTAVASYNSGNTLLQLSGVQIQSVLDHLYIDNGTAENAALGVTYDGGVPAVSVWAPTAQSVTLRRYVTSTGAEVGSQLMTFDPVSGVWSATAPDNSWDRQFYLFDVQVYVPSLGVVTNNLVTDPYAVSLSTDSLRSQFVNLDDPDLQPADWDSYPKPDLANFEDITIYEMHVRDFSINDSTVAQTDRGTYVAFTYDGAVGNPVRADAQPGPSNGMAHLLALKNAGLTHVHLLPAFDIASVPEASVPRDVWPNPTGYPRNSDQPQSIVGANRAADGFNWGYDPFHFGVPEGSYSTNPDGVQRIIEFREMVQVLNQNGLRVVMDVVYNHTAASGQWDKSVLDKVVPGYYHRYTATGALYTDSCCDDTASEYAMFEKLMIDTLVRFATDYKVDGFRFDLMNFHTRRNMENVQTAITAVDPDIYLYGEGWTFGSAEDKGFTNCAAGWCFADKYNMRGAGIGLFNDIIRDAAHGGYSQDSLGIRQQGFINGLSYDWNGYYYNNRGQSDLHASMNTLRSALRASGADWSGFGAPFANDPQESMPYVSKHDNETLFDQNVFKMPIGVTMAERVRAQNMGLSIVGLSQGVPFFHMASDILRSKSLDRNSYDSGDWFNRVDWTYNSNNFGVGLPPEWDNNGRWSIMSPLLSNTSLDPAKSDIEFAAAHLREILRIRQSSPLFRLTTMDAVNNQVIFFNGNNSVDGLIVMGLLDAGNMDPNYETIIVFFNASKTQQVFNIPGTAAATYALHPVHLDMIDADPVVKTASFNAGTFTIPARTTAVFVSTQLYTPPAPPSSLDWVGKMWPRGGVAHTINQGYAPAGFDIFVRVYEAGWTEPADANPNIACYLHWGKYGEPFTDLPMTWNAQIGNDDEYKATIPQATLNALTPGTYGFTAYCKKTNESGFFWKQDSYNITAQHDDDQGDGLITVIPSTTLYPAPAGGVFVHLFEWPWDDIAKECTFLAQKGFTAVQVSPPNEHIVLTANQGGDPGSQFPWWARYQPVSHDATKLTSRSGNLTDFQAMVTACNAVGVDVYVDAVINHMAYVMVGDPAAGTAGTLYNSGFPFPGTRFYGSQYGPTAFHTDCNILSYKDRNQVQRCKLSGLPDLNTGSPDVQTQIRSYLQALLNMGVKGFRIDASKHIAAHELGAILQPLTLPGGGTPFIYHEVIDTDSTERVRDWEYIPHGAVQEFEYSITAMGSKFNCGGFISDLQNVPGYSNMMASQFAVVFTDNHDNQRGHGPGGACIVDHRDGRVHLLANIFTLAYPYGYPMLTSSYYWTTDPDSDNGDSLGPPGSNNGGATWGPGLGANTRPVYDAEQSAGDFPANCSPNYPNDTLKSANLGQWVCEQRHDALANMAQFRQVTAGESVTNWQNIGGAPSNHIAFGLGDKGFVAINRTGANATTTYNTSLSPGVYCDIIHFDFLPASGRCIIPGTDSDAAEGDLIVVNSGGAIENRTVAAMDALAIHAGTRLDTDFSGLGSSYGLAWHAASANNLRLGVAWRTDDGAQRSGDWRTGNGAVMVTVQGDSGSGFVTGWIDWDRNGRFDPTDILFSNVEVQVGQTATIPFTIPDGVVFNSAQFNARFRLYDAAQTLRALPQPTGGAAAGEVEDYQWGWTPTAVTLTTFTSNSEGGTAVLLLTTLLLTLGAASVVGARRRR
jgi:pullulanase/glycogen debranching enzyme